MKNRRRRDDPSRGRTPRQPHEAGRATRHTQEAKKTPRRAESEKGDFMLKTNSKKARENIQNYITERHNCEEYAPEANTSTFKGIATAIYNDFMRVYTGSNARRSYPAPEAFAEYAAGLPGILDTCYYYNRSAVDDLGEILEETPEERARYSEEDAERLLSYLIYREIEKAART